MRPLPTGCCACAQDDNRVEREQKTGGLLRPKTAILHRMSDLYEAGGLQEDAPRPLADKLRPQTLADVIGQDHLLAPGGPIGRMVAENRPHSIVLWGPPGTGKTTIARLLSTAFQLHFVQLSAVFSGVADLKKTFDAARQRRKVGQGTLLFIDEIHRFNRSQQD